MPRARPIFPTALSIESAAKSLAVPAHLVRSAVYVTRRSFPPSKPRAAAVCACWSAILNNGFALGPVKRSSGKFARGESPMATREQKMQTLLNTLGFDEAMRLAPGLTDDPAGAV
jgi:hypothetical protein